MGILDLDMAFDSHHCVDMTTGVVGRTVEQFSRLLQFETIQMRSVLAGSDSSSGVPMCVLPYVNGYSTPMLDAMRTAFTDTLILNFNAGYTGSLKEVAPAFHPVLHKAAHAVIRLAIIVMADYAA